jgi:HPt (histidine-containing phosphotransfer) domain-containing protein
MAFRGSEPPAKTGHRTGRANRDSEPGGDAQPRANSTSVLDDVLLGELSEDVGTESVRGLVRGFIDLVPRRLATLRREADAGDAETLKEMSHTMGGSAAYVGAQQVVSRCRSLEVAADEGELDAAMLLIDELDRALDAALEALEARWLA